MVLRDVQSRKEGSEKSQEAVFHGEKIRWESVKLSAIKTNSEVFYLEKLADKEETRSKQGSWRIEVNQQKSARYRPVTQKFAHG